MNILRTLIAVFIFMICMATDVEAVILRAVLMDGREVEYNVTDGFTWKMEGNELAFSTGLENASVSYAIENVKEIRYFGAVGAVDKLASDSNCPIIALSREGREIKIQGIADAVKCRIIDVNGVSIYNNTIYEDTIISLDGFKSGIYIMYLNNNSSLKFLVK